MKTGWYDIPNEVYHHSEEYRYCMTSSGLKMIPPPMPIIPEKKPLTAPVRRATGIDKFLLRTDDSPGRITILNAATNRQTPRILL